MIQRDSMDYIILPEPSLFVFFFFFFLPHTPTSSTNDITTNTTTMSFLEVLPAFLLVVGLLSYYHVNGYYAVGMEHPQTYTFISRTKPASPNRDCCRAGPPLRLQRGLCGP